MFRSRLEARWAAFFDVLGIEWRYEPFELDGYIPDFILPATNLLVEVKPILKVEDAEQYAQKIVESGWEDNFLIVGAHWHLGTRFSQSWADASAELTGRRDWPAFQIAGLHGQYFDYWRELNEQLTREPISSHWEEPYFWNAGRAVFEDMAWAAFPIFGDPDAAVIYEGLHARVGQAWAQAHRATQWRPKP